MLAEARRARRMLSEALDSGRGAVEGVKVDKGATVVELTRWQGL